MDYINTDNFIKLDSLSNLTNYYFNHFFKTRIYWEIWIICIKLKIIFYNRAFWEFFINSYNYRLRISYHCSSELLSCS